MTRSCPFLAAAARRTAESGGDSAPLLSATSLDEALHVVHGPHGPLPLHATASCAPEVSSWAICGCPFLAAQARRAQASEASGEECAAPAPECAPGQGRSGCSAAALKHVALRRLAAAPFARIAFPPPGFGTTPLMPVRAPGGKLHWSAALRAGNKERRFVAPKHGLTMPSSTPTVPSTAVWRHSRALQPQGSATDTTASTERRGGAFTRPARPAVPLTPLTLHRQAARAPCAVCPALSAS